MRRLPVFLLDAANCARLWFEEKKGESMKQALKEFCIDMVRQVFGWTKPREGKLVFTRNAFHKMHEYQLTEQTLLDTFKHGEEVRKGDKMQVTRKYANYSVGLWYKTIYTPSHHNLPAEKRSLVITCWKGGEYA